MARRDRRDFGSVRKTPSGRYEARYTDPDGRRRNAPYTFAARSDAEAWLVGRRRAIDQGRWHETDDRKRDLTTFETYSQRWLETRLVDGHPLRPRTRDHYQLILDNHLLPEFGHRPVVAIKPADVRAWFAELLPDKPTMRSHTYSLLRAILNTAATEDVIEVNPCRIRGASGAKRVHKIRPASPKELAQLINEMPEEYRLLIALAGWCGLRFGELIELRRGDVDLGTETIYVRRAAYRVGGTFEVGPPKTEAGLRDVAIPPHLLQLLEDHLEFYADVGDTGMLFPTQNGGHLQPSTLYRHFYAARVAIGRPDLRVHDLRHTSAVLAAQTGATIAELMARLGHSSPGAAMRYQHAAKGRDREIAALMSKLADQ